MTMLVRTLICGILCMLLAACASHRSTDAASGASPLVIGESFTIESSIMGETRRMNVYIPTIYGQKVDAPLPVLYMPDGGIDEDFLHVAGLVQVLVSNGGMRPFMLVGIENTQRRRDMTGPTASVEDRKIAPVVGGSATFRRFIKEELMPAVRSRYRVTDETAIVGESLAGLFVVETFFVEPELFDTYIAFDPSLWWNNEDLVVAAETRLTAMPFGSKSLLVASSNEPALASLASRFAAIMGAHRQNGLVFQHMPLAEESHATVYHPAALRAFRAVLGPTTSATP